MSIGVYEVAQVRAAEAALMARVPEGSLMQRAAAGLEAFLAGMLTQIRGGVVGSRVVVLVGSGNNGGDALWAAAGLARRGARVDAVTLSDGWHTEGMSALLGAGGRMRAASDPPPRDHAGLSGLIESADAIVDGITGIGGRGGLRGSARDIARWVSASGAFVVAVDIPSGVDADTGAIGDGTDDASAGSGECIMADATVTFGCLKPGLLVAPGRFPSGALHLVDIGLDADLGEPRCQVLDELDIARCLPEPQDADYKYSRGVVGVGAGSRQYRGAGFLATDAARASGVGMVHYLAFDDELGHAIAARLWDVVVSADIDDPRITGYAVGPGWGGDDSTDEHLRKILAGDVPVVVDADGLRVLARHREWVRERSRRAGVTVITPHEGEFRALGFEIGRDRLDATRRAAEDLECVVVLKGPGTIIATPEGSSYVDTFGTAVLGTAGSGDVLTGLMGGMLAAARAREGALTVDGAALVSAAAVGVHGIAGRLAAHGGRPVTAMDIAHAIPDAIAQVRRGGR